MAKAIRVQGKVFRLEKDELINLKEECEDALWEIRGERVVKEAKKLGSCTTLFEYFGIGGK